jgi:hypothetical protein
MEKVKFTNKNIPEVVYEIVGENWIDNDTYLIAFNTMTDVDGDDFHMEVEYHKDENKIFYSRCYEHEMMDGTQYVSPCFKKQIDEYIMRQVGILRDGSFINYQKISVELTLDIPINVSLGDLNEWLKELTIEVKSPRADFIRVLDVKNIKQ